MSARLACVLMLIAVTLGCERETRRYRELPAASSRTDSVHLTDLQPGEPQPGEKVLSPYQKNAYGIAQGKTLYTSFNCSGWIQHPQKIEPGTAVPEMGVTDEDARDIAAYLYTLR